MRRLLLFGSGAAIGYVLGAKAGHERYDEIMKLVGAGQSHLPHSVSDAAHSGSRQAEQLTETARAEAHTAIGNVDQKLDDVVDHAQKVREQSEERLAGGG